jgi:hypothetical protein
MLQQRKSGENDNLEHFLHNSLQVSTFKYQKRNDACDFLGELLKMGHY